MDELTGVASGSATVRLWAAETGQLVRSLSLCATTSTTTVIEGLSSSSATSSSSSSSSGTHDNNSNIYNSHDNNGGMEEEVHSPSQPSPSAPTLPPHLLIQLQWVARSPVHTTLASGGSAGVGGLGAVYDDGGHGWLVAASTAGVTLWM